MLYLLCWNKWLKKGRSFRDSSITLKGLQTL